MPTSGEKDGCPGNGQHGYVNGRVTMVGFAENHKRAKVRRKMDTLSIY